MDGVCALGYGEGGPALNRDIFYKCPDTLSEKLLYMYMGDRYFMSGQHLTFHTFNTSTYVYI